MKGEEVGSNGGWEVRGEEVRGEGGWEVRVEEMRVGSKR